MVVSPKGKVRYAVVGAGWISQAPEPDGREGLADVCVIRAIDRALRMGAPQPVRIPSAPTRHTYDHAVQLELIQPPELVDAARPEAG